MLNSALKYKLFFILILSLLLLPELKAQDKPLDVSLPYNRKWEICDTPIAHYYRVGQISRHEKFIFTGEVKDYYQDGHLEMQGSYDSLGLKQGIFTYYYPNGKVERRGAYENDQMRGLWNYYGEDGKRFMAISCDSDREFTPVLYINKDGDTTLKNGHGQFTIPVSDHPSVFWNTGLIKIKFLQGECVNGKKEGTWKLYGDQGNYTKDRIHNTNLAFAETFENGKLKFAKSYAMSDYGEKEGSGRKSVSIYARKHINIESFAGDFSIYDGSGNRDDAYQFVFMNSKPSIVANSKSYANNMETYVRSIIAAVALNQDQSTDLVREGFSKDYYILGNGIVWLEPNQQAPASADLDISFKVTADGELRNIEIKGDSSTELQSTIQYYLSLINKLKPQAEGSTSEVKLHLKIQNELGLHQNKRAYYNYAVLSSTEQDLNIKKAVVHNSLIEQATLPEFGAKPADWAKYLSRELNLAFKKQPELKTNFTSLTNYTVDENGVLTDCEVIDSSRTLDPALALIIQGILERSPKWIPAKLQGKPINYKVSEIFRF